MGRGVRRATVHGVTQSQTRLTRLGTEELITSISQFKWHFLQEDFSDLKGSVFLTFILYHSPGSFILIFNIETSYSFFTFFILFTT